MVISSRTPEGQPGRCPVCNAALILEPSEPAGDAPSPRCGHLIWFTAEESDGVTIFRLTGEVVEAELIRQLVDLFGDRPIGWIIFDFGGVRYVPSAVLGALLNLNKQGRGRGVKLTLRGLHPDLREVFRITRLDQVLSIEE